MREERSGEGNLNQELKRDEKDGEEVPLEWGEPVLWGRTQGRN